MRTYSVTTKEGAKSKCDANDDCNDTAKEIIKDTAVIGQNRLIDGAKVFSWSTISLS